MELSFAFLANAADTSRGGRLTVMGADFDTLWVDRIPCIHACSMVAKFLIQMEERDQPNTAALRFRTPSGAVSEIIDGLPMKAIPHPLRPDRPTSACMLLALTFPIPEVGDYEFEILADGQLVKTIQLLVVLGPAPGEFE